MEVHEIARGGWSQSKRSQASQRRLRLAQDLRMMQDTVETEERTLVKAALAKAIELLTPRQKHYLMLYFGEGMNMQAIAQAEGVNPATVSRTLKRARRNLYRYLQFSSIRFLNDDGFVEMFRKELE